MIELVLLGLLIYVARKGQRPDVAALERRVARLEAELEHLRSGTVPATAPPPSVDTVVPVLPPADEAPQAEDALEPPLPTPEPATPRFRPPSIDWERWIGVQGAAVVGGVVLALAGLLFFRYSIEHGLISPALRIALGAIVGLACIVAPEMRWRSRYLDAANALTGAGIAILYGTVWAAHARYALVGFAPAFALMASVTAIACVLSVRHASLVVALLGLVGGFATPLLLASGAERPIALFGYLLLLDVALLAIAERRGWPILALASLAGTTLHQLWWIGFQMTGVQSPIALVILGVFALLFAFLTSRHDADETDAWGTTRAGAVLLPFGFAFFVASNPRIAPSLVPLSLLLGLLSAAATWIGRRQRRSWMALAAASGDVAVIAVWTLARALTPDVTWQLVLSAVGLAIVFHLFVETSDDARADGSGVAAGAAASGLLAALAVGVFYAESGTLWPWLGGWLALAALLQRNEARSGTPWLSTIAAAEVALGLFLALLYPRFLPPATAQVVLVLVAAAFQLATMMRAPAPARHDSERAAASIALLALVVLCVVPAPPVQYFVAALVLGALAAAAATRMASGSWYLATVAVTALTDGCIFLVPSHGPFGTMAFGLQLITVVLFTAWPLFASRLRDEVRTWWGAALAGPFWFLPMRELFVQRWGDAWIGMLPVALGLVAGAAAWQARTLWPSDDPGRRTALTWLGASALGFLTVTIPLQLDREWLAIGWALEAWAVTLLWRRLDHPGLKYFALALVVVVTARLATHDALFEPYPLPAWRIVNWLLYTYLVPAAAFLGVASVLAPREVARLLPWERESLYAREAPVGATVAGLAAIGVVFLWINLAIAEWFADSDVVRLTAERLPARDLTTSIAWALYALGLLAIGMARGIKGLRGLSLAFLLLAIGKVFLHDLGALRDLYRVAALLGLAASLILVSLAYQRFVFGGKAGG